MLSNGRGGAVVIDVIYNIHENEKTLLLAESHISKYCSVLRREIFVEDHFDSSKVQKTVEVLKEAGLIL